MRGSSPLRVLVAHVDMEIRVGMTAVKLKCCDAVYGLHSYYILLPAQKNWPVTLGRLTAPDLVFLLVERNFSPGPL